jgi:hypothetical protein
MHRLAGFSRRRSRRLPTLCAPRCAYLAGLAGGKSDWHVAASPASIGSLDKLGLVSLTDAKISR